MPPTQRARKYDAAKLAAAITAQLQHVRTAVAGLGEGQLALPTRLDGWTVRELVTHIPLTVGVVNRTLEAPAAPAREMTPVEWPAATAALAAHADEVARKTAAEAKPLDLLDDIAARFAELTSVAPADRLLAVRSGAMRLDDFLVTRCAELVVHTDDLADALGAEIPFDRQALAATARLFADTLAARAPGGSVEVRVPPFAVIQCIEGPRHTRGTPPNVVETDPLTWIRLAAGRVAWPEAVAAASVTASGERADISAQLPLLG
ncbi:sterol carrier family protein [Streptomyces sp. NPDC001262]|uniref:maleylpyruvate isomerase family mycothiol-dependent enzyme n=1 Tax=Streptomyces TaxID=1883 RepID=UPI0036CCBA84